MATEAFVNQKIQESVMVSVYKYFTTNTTFTVPSDVSTLTMAVTGAGGGGRLSARPGDSAQQLLFVEHVQAAGGLVHDNHVRIQ